MEDQKNEDFLRVPVQTIEGEKIIAIPIFGGKYWTLDWSGIFEEFLKATNAEFKNLSTGFELFNFASKIILKMKTFAEKLKLENCVFQEEDLLLRVDERIAIALSSLNKAAEVGAKEVGAMAVGMEDQCKKVQEKISSLNNR